MFEQVVEIFNGDVDKASKWYFADNEELGKAPCQMEPNELSKIVREKTKGRGRGGWNLAIN